MLELSYDPFKSDVWSLGVAFYIMITGNIPWNTASFATIKNDIISCNYTFPSEIPSNIKELISMMLIKDPNLRPSLSQIIQLPIFKTLIPPKKIKNTSFYHHRIGINHLNWSQKQNISNKQKDEDNDNN